MTKSIKPRPASVAMTEHFQKVAEAEAAVMDLTGPQAKAALMLLAWDFPKEVLEAIRDEL